MEEIKKNESTLFERLFDSEVCFAVVVSRVSFKSIGAGYSAVDYGCIINMQDKEKTEEINLKFYQPKNARGSKYHNYNILEYDMNDSEIAEFKTLQKKFIKVEHNSHGRVYELLTDSFKEKYITAIV